MRRSLWSRNEKDVARAAADKKRRIEVLLQRMKERAAAAEIRPTDVTLSRPPKESCSSNVPLPFMDCDFGVLAYQPNENLRNYMKLFDDVAASNDRIHLALLWPHIPPRAILPWMIREVSRGRSIAPMRAAFLNMGRPALQTLSGLGALTSRLQARGLHRAGVDDAGLCSREIGPDAHFYMFLGDTSDEIQSVPLISIVPHAIALNDGTYWRDFDEKTLKGFKRHFSADRLRAIRKHLDVLTSAERSPGFAFLLPSHFDSVARQRALACLPGSIDLAILDMTTQALAGREPSRLVVELLSELESNRQQVAKRVLIIADCPLRYSFLRRSAKRRKNPGPLGNKVESHRLTWAIRGRGFDPLTSRSPASQPIVETVASEECIVGTRLWQHARELEETNPLTSVLQQAAATLKGMALTASGADAMLAPYQDVHDVYHRMKRERHSFDPHYNKAMALLGEGRGAHLREDIARDLAEGLVLANAIRDETPLLRYLKRVLDDAGRYKDVLVVLRHAEDAQQANDRLLDYLTEPGRFIGHVPNLRVTTPSRYAGEVQSQAPSVIVWAAAASTGARAYIGDSLAPEEFRLIVAGQDAVTLRRTLDLILEFPEFATYHQRTTLLRNALTWAPRDFGGIATALGLDLDKPRNPVPFTGQGYLLLDGYGKVAAAGPGTQFYVLDPITQQLQPREARSIDNGDAVFVMPDDIREEIESILREKDDRGRTLEQQLVDQYKTIVKNGIASLSVKEGKRITGVRIHEMLFAQNLGLPRIGKQAVDYWLQAADHFDVDTPFAADDPRHLEAFLRLMGAGVIASQLADAIRIVRRILQREGHINRGLFDRLLLDPDSLIHGRKVTFEKLTSLRDEARQNVFTVLSKNLVAATSRSANERNALINL